MIARLREALLHDRKLLPPVVVAVLCLSLPNLVVMFWPRFDHRQAEVFWMGMGVIMLPCLLPITVRSALLLWTPFSAFIPAAVIYVLVTGSALR